jgi:predicted Zn finger-like uncharacterized protein
MQTECPQCETVFRVRADQLGEADGRVRCGVCGEVFNAMDTLQAELGGQEDWTQAAPGEAGDTATSPAVDIDLQEYEEQGRVPLDLELREPGGDALTTALLALGGLVLIVLLGAQYLYYDRQRLIASPELRPWILHLCAYLPCDAPPLHDVSAIELLERNVFIHPNIDGALMITGKMVNNARFPQPLPTLQVSLSNLRGKVVAARRFRPGEYLSDKTREHVMAPGIPVSILLEVDDPGTDALAYEFQFL